MLQRASVMNPLPHRAPLDQQRAVSVFARSSAAASPAGGTPDGRWEAARRPAAAFPRGSGTVQTIRSLASLQAIDQSSGRDLVNEVQLPLIAEIEAFRESASDDPSVPPSRVASRDGAPLRPPRLPYERW